jgi:hypothetical protein
MTTTTALDTPENRGDNPLLGWALYFAAMGWHVFPLRPGTKQPAIKDWENRSTTSTDRIRTCWVADQWNIGIATGPSRLVVGDLDMPKEGDLGPDGLTALTAVAAERGGPIPETYAVSTPSVINGSFVLCLHCLQQLIRPWRHFVDSWLSAGALQRDATATSGLCREELW